jgi:hypothetical protein
LGATGLLTVTDGAKIIHLTLKGSYATSNFRLANDGHGGTFVYDPPTTPTAAATPQARFAQAMAGFSGRHRDFGAIQAGGTAVTSAPPMVAAAMSGR